jgi:hypothetical protein
MLNKIRTEPEMAPKLTLPHPKATKIFYKVLTLNAGTRKLAGNKGFPGVAFS